MNKLMSIVSIAGSVEYLADPRSTLQYDVRQHDVHAYNFVRSPITIQPASHAAVHLRSSDHMRALDVAFSVLVVNENFCTIQMNSSSLHFFKKLE